MGGGDGKSANPYRSGEGKRAVKVCADSLSSLLSLLVIGEKLWRMDV